MATPLTFLRTSSTSIPAASGSTFMLGRRSWGLWRKAARFYIAASVQPSPPAPTELAWDTSRMLGPAPPDSLWWDRHTFGGPVVTRDPFYQVRYSPYRLYYHGRERDEWSHGITPFDLSLQTGRIGLAMSEDGLRFDRFKGPLEGGAIMNPSEDPHAFDSVHVGVSDAFFRGTEAKWYIYFYGGSIEGDGMGGRKMLAGLAFSKDGIIIEERQGPILEAGEPGSWDENGVICPRILPPWQHGDRQGAMKGKWLLSYYTKENGGPNGEGFYSGGTAISENGIDWEKQGRILPPGPPGSWDEAGVKVCHAIRQSGLFYMFYEGFNYKSESGIGLAISEDGYSWNKDTECGPEPGGPVLMPRKGEDFWDNLWIGAPYLISMYDGSLRMYYAGYGKREGETAIKQGFGIGLSDRINLKLWRRYSPNDPGPPENKRGFELPRRPNDPPPPIRRRRMMMM